MESFVDWAKTWAVIMNKTAKRVDKNFVCFIWVFEKVRIELTRVNRGIKIGLAIAHLKTKLLTSIANPNEL